MCRGWIVSGPDLSAYHEILAEELNVEVISLEEDLDRFQKVEVVPNRRSLEQSADRICLPFTRNRRRKQEAMLASIEAGNLTIAGYEISKDDIELRRVEREGFAAQTVQITNSSVSLVLDMSDSPELLSKGLARDITRRIQAARKDLDLAIEDTISLEVWMKDAPELFEEDTNWIITETRASNSVFNIGEGNGESFESMGHNLVQGNEVLKMKRVAFAILLAASTMLAGCFGGGESVVEEAESETPIWSDYQIIDPIIPISPWEFTTVDLNLNESTTTSWAVFNKDYGGNCCEHYLATTIDGTILNIGGEYPVWSHDRGHEWDTYIPGVFTDPMCRTPVPTNPGQEGLGEGSIVQATNGDIISMSWFPYVGGDLKLDKFTLFFTMLLKTNGPGVTTESQNRSTTDLGKLKS